MDLPPCPSCGEELHAESPRGPARCRSCGFVTPLELDAAALSKMLDDASHRGLGPRPMLSHSKGVEGPRLEGHTTPMLIGSSQPPETPRLSPPPRPREIGARAPPPLADPKDPVPMGGKEGTSTRLGDGVDASKDARRRDLRAKGELFR